MENTRSLNNFLNAQDAKERQLASKFSRFCLCLELKIIPLTQSLIFPASPFPGEGRQEIFLQ